MYICIMERWDFRGNLGSDLLDSLCVIDNVFLLTSYLGNISHQLIVWCLAPSYSAYAGTFWKLWKSDAILTF